MNSAPFAAFLICVARVLLAVFLTLAWIVLALAEVVSRCIDVAWQWAKRQLLVPQTWRGLNAALFRTAVQVDAAFGRVMDAKVSAPAWRRSCKAQPTIQ